MAQTDKSRSAALSLEEVLPWARQLLPGLWLATSSVLLGHLPILHARFTPLGPSEHREWQGANPLKYLLSDFYKGKQAASGNSTLLT